MRDDAKDIFNAAVASVVPDIAVYNHLKIESGNIIIGTQENNIKYLLKDLGGIYVFGAGKASVPMAIACEEILGNRINYGHIITKKGASIKHKFKYFQVTEGGHPVPDEDGMMAARSMITYLQGTKANDLIILLLSGGGSALLAAPIETITLQDLQKTTNELLACGATIHEMNTIRKHVSSIKGGNFARHASPSNLVTLILSDVVGDTLDVIGSGPTIPDSSTFQDCIDIIDKYNKKRPMSIPFSVINHFRLGKENSKLETPKKDDPIFNKTHQFLVANNYKCLSAAKNQARKLGYNPIILSSAIEGEAKEVGKVLVSLAKEVKTTGNPIAAPACGETTVTINGTGKGGRNQEMALSALGCMEDLNDVTILCAGTDGGDGPTDAAGAVVDSELLKESKQMGLNIQDYLRNNDSYHFFNNFGDNHLKPGQTGTNVMDIDIILIN